MSECGNGMRRQEGDEEKDSSQGWKHLCFRCCFEENIPSSSRIVKIFFLRANFFVVAFNTYAAKCDSNDDNVEVCLWKDVRTRGGGRQHPITRFLLSAVVMHRHRITASTASKRREKERR